MTESFRDAVVISDLHLWDTGEPRYRAALAFLRALPREVDLLVVLGDLFDFWISDNGVLAGRFREVIEAITEIRARGVAVLYCEGNHDLHLEAYFGRALGLDTFRGERTIRIGGYVVHLSHGDLVNPRDRGYLFLRWFLRTPLIRWLVRVTPDSWQVAVGERSSRTSRAYTRSKTDPIGELSRDYARDRIENGAEVVVIGHTHLPERTEIVVDGGRRGIYLNTGLWLADGTRWWARIRSSGVELRCEGPSCPSPSGREPTGSTSAKPPAR